MTRMSADDRIDDTEHDLYDEAPPRSIFATMWFRAVLILIVLAVVVAVAVPYILDATNPPKPTIASRPQPGPAPSPPAAVTPPAPATPSSSALSTQGDSAPDKPAPSTPAAAGEKAAPTESAKMVAAASELKPTTRRAARSTMATSAPRPTTTTEWWVQVGAYREEGTARKVAARLREQNYAVEESVRSSDKPIKAAAVDKAPAAPAPSSAGVDQYDVFVAGVTTDELNSRLAGRGLTADASGTGAVVKPSLPLRDAVALSKDLATDGLKVQVRRAGSTGETTIPAAEKRRVPAAASSSDPLYRVRVGSFPDRATAVATLKELESKGYKPFIARGGS
jgi:SPOR domain